VKANSRRWSTPSRTCPAGIFFLNTLDAPGKLDHEGKVIMPKSAPAPERQVSNGTANLAIAKDP